MLTIISMFSKYQQGPKFRSILPHQPSVLQVPGIAACVIHMTACERSSSHWCLSGSHSVTSASFPRYLHSHR